MKKATIIFLSLFFLGLLFLTYSNHFHNGFEFDDGQAVTNNLWLRDIKNIPLFFTDGKYSSTMATNQAYRPVVVTLDAIDYWLAGGADSFYFHLSIFFWYLVQLIMLFFVFKSIFNSSFPHHWNNYIALFATAYYAMHSANAETINYIDSRSDSFSTVCIVAGFLLWQNIRMRKYHLYLIPMIISIYTKETGVMFAPLLFLYILFFEEGIAWGQLFSAENKIYIRRSLYKALPALIISFGLFFINMKFFTPAGTDSYNKSITGITYFFSQLHVIRTHYLYNFFIPLKLCADPDDFPVITSLLDSRAFAGMLVVLMMMFVAFYFIQNIKTRPIAFGICWFFISLAPTSSFIPRFQFANDHRVFFPYIGLILSISWGIGLLFIKYEEQLTKRKILRYSISSFLILIICGYAFGAHARNQVWASSELLWKDVAVKSPNNSRGLMNYGLSLMEKGEFQTAEEYYNRALKISPRYSILQVNMAILNAAKNKPLEAEKHFNLAIEYNIENAEAYYFYARWLYKNDRKQEAKKMLEKGVMISPGNFRIEEFLNTLNTELSQEGKSKIEIYTSLIQKEPTPENYLELSLAYYKSQDYQNCIASCEKALQLRPEFAAAYNNMCAAYNKMQQWENAAAACKKALEISPEFELAKNNFQWAKEEMAKLKK